MSKVAHVQVQVIQVVVPAEVEAKADVAQGQWTRPYEFRLEGGTSKL